MIRIKKSPLLAAAFLSISSIAFLVTTPAASARLGETVSECEARYGEVRLREKPQAPESDEYAVTFIKSGIRIIIEYKDGKAWKLTYEGDFGMSTNYAALLRSNNDDAEWGPSLDVLGKSYWVRPDGKAHAVGHPERQKNRSTLTVLDEAFLKVRAAAYKSRLARAEEIRTEYLEQANPLPGF